MMLPQRHLLISTIIGAVGWWRTRDARVCLASLAAGVLPDLDHLVDYGYYCWRREHRLILPMHGYEYAFLGAVVSLLLRSSIGGVASLSYLVHLLADQMENKTRRLGYSVIFRVWHRFRIEDISAAPEAAIQGRVDDLKWIQNTLC